MNFLQGEIGLNAAHMVMELVKDNRRIVDRITHEHIDNFVGLLHKNKAISYILFKHKKTHMVFLFFVIILILISFTF